MVFLDKGKGPLSESSQIGCMCLVQYKVDRLSLFGRVLRTGLRCNVHSNLSFIESDVSVQILVFLLISLVVVTLVRQGLDLVSDGPRLSVSAAGRVTSVILTGRGCTDSRLVFGKVGPSRDNPSSQTIHLSSSSNLRLVTHFFSLSLVFQV